MTDTPVAQLVAIHMTPEQAVGMIMSEIIKLLNDHTVPPDFAMPALISVYIHVAFRSGRTRKQIKSVMSDFGIDQTLDTYFNQSDDERAKQQLAAMPVAGRG